jgi:AcrR family transcriptional regulator
VTRSFDQPSSTRTSFSRASGEQTRRALLDAAVTLVAERGWDAVTTRQIAERAGVNQGLIHYHFRSKDQLVHAAFERALRETFAEPGAALARATDLRAAITDMVRGLEPGDEIEAVALFSVEAMARGARDEEIRRSMAEMLAEFRQQLAGRIASGQWQGEISADLDPVGAATVLGALLDGLGLHVLIDPSIDIERTAVAAAMVIGPPGPPSSGR